MQDPESSQLLVPFLRKKGSLRQKPITNSTTDCFLIPTFIIALFPSLPFNRKRGHIPKQQFTDLRAVMVQCGQEVNSFQMHLKRHCAKWEQISKNCMNLKVFNTFIKHAHHSRNLTNLHFLLKYIVNK